MLNRLLHRSAISSCFVVVPTLLTATLALQGCSAAAAPGTATVATVDQARMHVLNKPLSLSKPTGAIKAQDFTATESGYTYAASVDAPQNPATGDVLQATNFAFDDTHAYVTYNMAGPKAEGALDILDMTDASHPLLMASLVFPDSEFADVAIRGDYAFLVGAGGDGGLLTVVDVSDRTQPKAQTSLALGSFYGTSITLDGATAYVTSGDTGGVVRVDLTNPAGPVLLDTAPLPNALSTVRTAGKTLAMGGATDTRLYMVSGTTTQELAVIGSERFEAPGRMAFANGHVITNGGHSGLSVLSIASDFASAKVAFHADLTGTGNGIDVAGSLALLAQGEAGTILYDLSTPEAPMLLGSFAFPDDHGSANQVRFGATAAAQFVFLGDGLGGFRIVQIASSVTGSSGAMCGVEWWLASLPGEWWGAPATSSDPSPGAWVAVPEETDSLCVVEEFVPNAANADCSAIGIKRAIAIGPKPNEGQVCPVRCPTGTVIANVHSRYGEASPLNSGGDYSCTGTTEPDSHEIDCDVMSDFCDGTQSSCSVDYQNSFCGDPWYDCIKSGRTKWQCVPQAAIGGH